MRAHDRLAAVAWVLVGSLAFAGDQAAIEACRSDVKAFERECLAHCQLKKRPSCEAHCASGAKMIEKECQHATNDDEPKKKPPEATSRAGHR